MGSIGFNSNSQLQVNGTPLQTGFKNHIINGNFDVWQYGTSQTTSGYGSDDRWANSNTGSTKTHSQVACTNTERALFNATYFSRTVVSSVVGASNFVNKTQTIENVTKLAGKTVTISFWAKADTTKNIQLMLAQNYGTGGSPSTKTFIEMPIIQLTSTWQKKIVTIQVPTIIGKTLGTDGVHTSSTQLYFVFEAGTSWSPFITLGQQSGTFDIAQVQIEEGSVATPFEQRPYGLELSLCQRYVLPLGIEGSTTLWIGGYCTGSAILSSVPTPVTMRTTPSFIGGTLQLSCAAGAAAISTIEIRGHFIVLVANQTNTTGQSAYVSTTIASGFRGFSAEL